MFSIFVYIVTYNKALEINPHDLIALKGKETLSKQIN
jgi:hypothetical protein